MSAIREAGRGYILLKRDTKSAFRHIPLSPKDEYLLGFTWDGLYYVERCLSFGLRTAPVIFNLFAEALEWTLFRYTDCPSVLHYLDDFIMVISVLLRHRLSAICESWVYFTDILGIERRDEKDDEGTTVEILGIEFNTTDYTVRLSSKKLKKLHFRIKQALKEARLFALYLDRLSGYLS